LIALIINAHPARQQVMVDRSKELALP